MADQKDRTPWQQRLDRAGNSTQRGAIRTIIPYLLGWSKKYRCYEVCEAQPGAKCVKCGQEASYQVKMYTPAREPKFDTASVCKACHTKRIQSFIQLLLPAGLTIVDIKIEKAVICAWCGREMPWTPKPPETPVCDVCRNRDIEENAEADAYYGEMAKRDEPKVMAALIKAGFIEPDKREKVE